MYIMQRKELEKRRDIIIKNSKTAPKLQHRWDI